MHINERSEFKILSHGSSVLDFTVHNGNCLLVLCFVSFCSSEWLDCLMVGSGSGRTDVVQLQLGPGDLQDKVRRFNT